MSIQHKELMKQYKKKIKDNLMELNFFGNRIGNEGAKALAAVLPTSSLIALNLQDNLIGNGGIQALGNALPTSSLISLNLKDNCIRAEGTESLAKALPKVFLTVLNFWDNNIGDEGIKYLKKAVFTPGCRICKTGLSEIDETLKPRNKKLLMAANKLLLDRYAAEISFNKLSNDKKINLFFTIKDTQIKCRNLIMEFFLKKNSNDKNKISALLPIPELLHHVLSFVFPVLSGQDISKSWEMAEEKLSTILAAL